MGRLTLLSLTFLLTSCALPFGLHWPRMPWQKPPPQTKSCVISLETGSAASITTNGGAAVQMGCSVDFNSRPAPTARR